MTADEGMPAVGTLRPTDVARHSPAPQGHVDPARPPEPDPGPPTPGSSQDALVLRDIVARLSAVWPTVDEAVVEAAVRSAYEAFREARLRAYVPILAERRARKALGTAVGGPSAGHGQGHADGERR
ncbi:three-helix bundle dimerization domain-containing protein [Streptomyces sp. NPDC002324]